MNLNIRYFCEYDLLQWEKLLLNFKKSISYSFWFLKYQEILFKKLKIKNFSFVVLDKENPCAIFPLYVENINNVSQISFGEEPVYSPIFAKNFSSNNKRKIINYGFEVIKKYKKKYNVETERYQISPFHFDKKLLNFYIENNFKDVISYPDWYIFKCNKTFVLDLNQEFHSIKKKIRKGHYANFKKTLKYAKLNIISQENPDRALFNHYIKSYYKVKGQKRTKQAFELDFDGINGKYQVIFCCIVNDRIIGAVAIHTYGKLARYNSSFRDIEFCDNLFPTHYLLMESIKYLKEKGFELLEIGGKVDSKKYSISDKEFNLSHFKSGWGGDCYPWYKFER